MMGKYKKKYRSDRRRPSVMRLSSEAQRIISYWRQCLVDGRRMELSGREVAESGVKLQYAALQRGAVPAGVVEALNAKAAAASQKARDQRRVPGYVNENAGALAVLAAPLQFKLSAERGLNDSRPAIFEPLWIPALLLRSGELVPAPPAIPWIPRSLLEPAGREGTAVVGDLDDAEEYFVEKPPPRDCSWNDYWRYCSLFFRAVAGDPPERWSFEDYEKRPDSLLIVDTIGGGGTANLERLYNDILNLRRPLALLAALLPLQEPKRRLLAKGIIKSARLSARHVGQFGRSFALADSQRQAVHESLALKPREILAVTGPPGTGKTTLIQSLIASHWIEAALRKSRPPVILVCSATNQAVTNVIDTFARAIEDQGELAGRWVPELNSHATFCASFSRAAEGAITGQIELTDGSGLSAAISNWEYLGRAEELFLNKVAARGYKTGSVKRATDYLHSRTKKEVTQLRRSISSEMWCALWARISGSAKDSGGLPELFRQLDVSSRHRAFLLATHYWEGRWLIETAELLRAKKLPPPAGSFSFNRADWERRAMLTPCFVATFSSVARFFGREREALRPAIDLLIADEAGQVSPEVGAAPFALAEKAVVIGDAEQLEPVWGISNATDQANMVRSGLLKEGDQRRSSELQRSAISAASSSLMRRAIKVCPVQDHSTIGVFLSEHRRSVPRIVEFANAIAYRGRLTPFRPDEGPGCLPPFAFAHVRGISSVSGKSRLNRIEAECIADWLKQHREMLEDSYQKNLEDLAAVLTPFVAQNRYLRSLLSRRWPKLTIGTVNSLQGAERRIVIFSPVYDQSEERRKIFDRSTNMLNVAVTRAMDSFVVFGDMGGFDPEAQTPSGILARFLFSSPDNEIVDIEPAAAENGHSFERLSTLDQHREVLLRALRGARSEVIIVSPTISLHPIRIDQLDREISAARKRGIDVRVYTDENLDKEASGAVREAAKMGRELLIEAGARLIITRRIHNKSLAVDDCELIEGSFNWLSAVRRRGALNQKLEVSVRYTGEKAREAIVELRRDLSERALPEE